jgi:transcriptional regulator with XRE-family HTH domain
MSTIKHIRLTIFQMDQKEFAKAVGVNQSTVSKWERGATLTLKNVVGLRRAAIDLGLPWSDELLFSEPDTTRIRRQELELEARKKRDELEAKMKTIRPLQDSLRAVEAELEALG